MESSDESIPDDVTVSMNGQTKYISNDFQNI